MALAATIYKADVDLSDMDRHYYQHHALTLARHPSETAERMMVRLLAFLQHANGQLKFTKGLSETSEPDLWLKDPTGRTVLWIETGLPDARRLARASGKADQVVVYAYGRQAQQWWKQTEKMVDRLANLSLSFACRTHAGIDRNGRAIHADGLFHPGRTTVSDQ
jgi:uncharacterized protein YaeQ